MAAVEIFMDIKKHKNKIKIEKKKKKKLLVPYIKAIFKYRNQCKAS